MKKPGNSVTEVKTHFILEHSQRVLSECKKVLEKIRKSEAEISAPQDQKQMIHNFGIIDKLLYYEPKRIVTECNLPANWEKPIRDFLSSGKLELPVISSLQPILTYNYEKHQWELFIQIFRKTTSEDLQKADWKMIKELQSKWLEDFDPIEMSQKDILMVKLYNEGKSMREIGEVIYGSRAFDETEISKRIRLVGMKLKLSKDRKR